MQVVKEGNFVLNFGFSAPADTVELQNIFIMVGLNKKNIVRVRANEFATERVIQ